MADTLKLPVGVDSFEKIRRNRFYYIDKTKLIEQLVEMGGEVTLFTRPRRFGKTLNMSMLRSFFEIGADALLFEGLYIAKNKSLCEALLSTNDFYDPRDFGFTDHEVKKILDDYGLTSHLKEIKEWYDGYLFGNEEIYNPWSVINYISKGGIPQAYWVNTGKNEILEDVLGIATDDITERLYALLQGEPVIARIDQNVVYRSIAEDPANIYSLLLVAGYLKTPRKDLQADGSYLCEVSIPNREIAAVYKNEILSHLLQIGAITRTTANKIAESLYANDYKKLQAAISEYMDKSISFYDGGAEGFYHGLMLGLIALMDNQYKIKSNRESGDGRYDISLIPRENRYPGIILELKWKNGLSADSLDTFADEALTQIDNMRYDSEMKQEGINDILKFGIAFSGKKVRVKTK